jgi:hypothetical protein
MWVSSKGLSPRVHNLPGIGELVWVEFLHGRLESGIWSYSGPLKGAKPEEFKSEKVYGFKSPGGYMVLIDEIDETMSMTHPSGQSVIITKEFTKITSEDIRLTQEEVEEKSPLGNSLDNDIKSALSKLESLLGDLSTFSTTQAAVSAGPLEPYKVGYTTLNTKAQSLKSQLSKIITKFEDGSHLSDKVKLS